MPAKNQVFAIWLEAADLDVIQELMADGQLPTLEKCWNEGTFAELRGSEMIVSETVHPMLLSGCHPETTGAWSVLPYDPQTYQPLPTEPFTYTKFPPFFALPEMFRAVVFDISEAPLFEEIHATQVVAWGAHAPLSPRLSKPAHLSQEIVKRFGDHPTGLGKDHADFQDAESLRELHRKLIQGLQMRESATIALCQELEWDLFLTGIPELHSAGHFLTPVDTSDSPLSVEEAHRMLTEIYRESDRILGNILESLPDQTVSVIFSVHGMRFNHEDPPNLILLPELMFRHAFGHQGLDFGQTRNLQQSWREWGSAAWKEYSQLSPGWHRFKKKFPERISLWAEKICGRLPEPFPPRSRVELNGHPSTWYRPYWHRMPAFALPTHSDGLIRLNVAGREANGIVPTSEYLRVREEIVDILEELTLPNSAEPAVSRIIRTRVDGPSDHPQLPQADLIVQWNSKIRGHFVSPRYGTFGPVPIHRTGAHTPQGFLIAQGNDIPSHQRVPTGSPVDVSATILDLLGAPRSKQQDGRPLIPQSSSSFFIRHRSGAA